MVLSTMVINDHNKQYCSNYHDPRRFPVHNGHNLADDNVKTVKSPFQKPTLLVGW